jgi:O-antigen/teichoic acid export membrane protein
MKLTNRKIASGFGWVAVITYTNRVFGLLTTLVLAKMVAPEDFGVVAVASILTSMLSLLKDMGFSEAIIYQKRDDQDAIDTANTLLIGLNVLLYAIAAAAAPLVAWSYDRPILVPIILILSTNLIWDAARAIPRALTRKNIDFRRLVIPEVVPVFISSALSLWMAVAGYGVWSLVAKTVVHSLLGMLLMRSLPEHRPRLRLNRAAAREMMGYGKFIVGTTVLLVTLYNIDRLYVSHFAGIAALGLFELAMRLVELPVKELSFVIGGVMFPVFARMDRGDGSLGRAILKTLKYTAFITAPLAVGIAVYGPAVVRGIYGEKWAGMIVPMQILAGYGMLRSFSSIIHDGFKASGRPDLMMQVVSYKLAAIGTLGIPALMFYGLPGICALIALTYAVGLVWELVALSRLLGVDLSTMRGLMPPIVLPVVVVPGTYLAASGLLGAFSLWQLALVVPITVVVYLTSIWLLDRQAVSEVRSFARSM